MKNLLFALTLMATLPRVAIGQKNVYHFGPIKEYKIPALDRHGRYADSARMYMKLMIAAGKNGKMDSAFFYDRLMGQHRHMESWRQSVVKDSAWRIEMSNKATGWRVYHGGKQSINWLVWNGIMNAISRSVLFLNTSDRLISCPGEYVPMAVDVDAGIFYSHAGSAVPTLIPGAPSGAQVPIGGPHNAGGLAKGQLWMYGQWVPTGAAGMSGGSSSMVQITTDSLGNYIDSVIQCFEGGTNYGQFWNMGFTTSTGKGYLAGETESGIEANGTWGNPWTPKPVQVTLPGSRGIKKLQGGYFVEALATDGTAWTWGGGGYNYWLGQGNSPTWLTPGQLPLGAGMFATDIASNGQYSYVLANDGSGNQHLFAFCQQYYEDYIGVIASISQGTFGTTVRDISSYIYPYLEPGHKIASISVSSNATYVVMDNGWSYGWGGMPCGELGTGQMLDWNSHGPYAWDFGPHELQQVHPVRLMPGITNIRQVLTCLSNSFYASLVDSNYVNYSAGRNKGQAQVVSLSQDSTTSIANANYVAGTIGADLPDSWEESRWRHDHIGRVKQSLQVTSNYCILNPTNSSKGCNTFTNPASKPITGTISATYINGIIILSAWAKTCVNPFLRMTWIDSAGKDDMGCQTEVTDTIRTEQNGALVAGPHKYYWTGITNAYDTAKDSITIVVNVGSPTVKVTPANQTIYLPATSGTLSCTASGAAGATVTTYAWTQISGPNTATLGSPGAASTSMSGLIAGTYEFQIKITDSNGNTATATTFVYIYRAFNGLTVPLPTTFKH